MKYKLRRIIGLLILCGGVITYLLINPNSYEEVPVSSESDTEIVLANSGITESSPKASDVLARLGVKGRAPKTDYARTEFYDDWPNIDGCSLRQKIIKREFGDSAKLNGCDVVSGEYDEPYTGQHKVFTEKSAISQGVQIDHVVALSKAGQTGAQYKTPEERYNLATDPLNLLAVDSSANQQKSDGDAATWLPSNKSFRCQYAARQIAVKYKYALWVTSAEHDALANILSACPDEKSPGVSL